MFKISLILHYAWIRMTAATHATRTRTHAPRVQGAMTAFMRARFPFPSIGFGNGAPVNVKWLFLKYEGPRWPFEFVFARVAAP